MTTSPANPTTPVRNAKKVDYFLAAITLLSWAHWIWFGYTGMDGIRSQHVPGYPNSGQYELYITVPILMGVIAILSAFLLLGMRWIVVGRTALIVLLLAIFPYACVAFGGV
jgi:hypothetical protein